MWHINCIFQSRLYITKTKLWDNAMFRNYQLNLVNKNNSLFAKGLILLFIFSFSMISCVPRSVRHGATNNKTEIIKKNDNSQNIKGNQISKDDPIAKVNEFADMINSRQEVLDNFKVNEPQNIEETAYNETYQPENPIETNETRKIPTLREQMKLFSDKQNLIEEKVDLLQSDVDDVKQQLTQIKHAIMQLDANENHEYSKGAPVVKKAIDSPKKKDEYIILPDEKEKETKIDEGNNTKIISDNFELLNSGKKDVENGNYDEAIKYFETLVKSEKNLEILGESHFFLGESYFAKNQFEKAINNYKKVIEIEKAKRKDKAQSQIAESYIKSGNINEAKNAYSALISNFPKSIYIPKAKKMLQQL